MAKRTQVNSESVLASILAEESFWPSEPQSISDTGLPVSVIEGLSIKRLSVIGSCSGRQLAGHLCLPFHMFDGILKSLRERQIIVHAGSAPFNDYIYTLTEGGRDRAAVAMKACAYVGPAPVPLADYVLSAEAQTIRAESPRREELHDAFQDISVNEAMFDSLGPAINSGAGLFLYGEPGNGKSTLARRITKCFGQQVWIPRTIIEDGQLIKLFDPSLHRAAQSEEEDRLSNASYDRRWLKIDRPTVVVGGELTMDALEIRHDPVGNISEAPLQMKSNCGCFLIDDFGRQRIEPSELLNRWIVPLESRFDFLTLSTGKKIQVPFEQLIIFSTNLEPCDLVDEAFLRRIPYKVHVSDPGTEEYHELFEIYAREFGCTYRPDVVDYLIDRHYKTANRPMRRCHPRDLLNQIRNFCAYNDLPVEMRDDYFDRVVKSYFAVVVNTPTPIIDGAAAQPPAPSSSPAVAPSPAVAQSSANHEESKTMKLEPEALAKPTRQRTNTAAPNSGPGREKVSSIPTKPQKRPTDGTMVCKPAMKSPPNGSPPGSAPQQPKKRPRVASRPKTLPPQPVPPGTTAKAATNEQSAQRSRPPTQSPRPSAESPRPSAESSRPSAESSKTPARARPQAPLGPPVPAIPPIEPV